MKTATLQRKGLGEFGDDAALYGLSEPYYDWRAAGKDYDFVIVYTDPLNRGTSVFPADAKRCIDRVRLNADTTEKSDEEALRALGYQLVQPRTPGVG
jgi:hypothetical protein